MAGTYDEGWLLTVTIEIISATKAQKRTEILQVCSILN